MPCVVTWKAADTKNPFCLTMTIASFFSNFTVLVMLIVMLRSAQMCILGQIEVYIDYS